MGSRPRFPLILAMMLQPLFFAVSYILFSHSLRSEFWFSVPAPGDVSVSPLLSPGNQTNLQDSQLSTVHFGLSQLCYMDLHDRERQDTLQNANADFLVYDGVPEKCFPFRKDEECSYDSLPDDLFAETKKILPPCRWLAAIFTMDGYTQIYNLLMFLGLFSLFIVMPASYKDAFAKANFDQIFKRFDGYAQTVVGKCFLSVCSWFAALIAPILMVSLATGTVIGAITAFTGLMYYYKLSKETSSSLEVDSSAYAHLAGCYVSLLMRLVICALLFCCGHLFEPDYPAARRSSRSVLPIEEDDDDDDVLHRRGHEKISIVTFRGDRSSALDTHKNFSTMVGFDAHDVYDDDEL